MYKYLLIKSRVSDQVCNMLPQSLLLLLLISSPIFAAPSSDEVIVEEDPIPEGAAGDKRIVNGRLADKNEFPFMCSVQRNPAQPDKFCGASLIDSCWLVTAAHCFDHVNNINNLRINCGITDAFDYGFHSQLLNVKKYVCHPKYGKITNANDICLVKVEPKVKCKRNVQLATLPPKDSNPGGKGSICGWGFVDEKESIRSNYLWTSAVSVSSKAECALKKFDIDDTQICVGASNLDTTACQGDSGSPYVEKNVVHGVLSYGSYKGCNPLEPVVYTKVSKYIDWINETLDKEGRCGPC